MRILLRFLLIPACIFLSGAAVDAAQWARTYGGVGDGSANSVRPTPDGGYVVAGSNTNDAWVLKLDAGFNVVWQRAFARNQDYAADVQPTSDGGYLVVGSTFFPETPSSSYRVDWLLKLDDGGHLLWEVMAPYSAFSTVQPDAEGGYVVAGWTQSQRGAPTEAWVLKLDAGGNFVWAKTYGGDYASAVVPANDGGYVVLGYFGSFGIGTWVLRLDAAGNIVWQKWYGGCVASDLQIASDGGYVLVGYVSSGPGNADACLLKVDETGNLAWQKVFGGTDLDYAKSVLAVAAGGYVVAGYTRSFGAGNDDAWLLKLDATGNIVWQRTYGGPGWDRAFSVQATADGGYLIAGSTSPVPGSVSNAWLLKVDANGAIGDCALMGTSNALALDSSVVASTTTATVTASAVPPSGPLLQTYATDVTPVQQCYDPSPASRLTAVEYYYRSFDHYFLTTLPQEIAALDAGAFPGWMRTGKSFQTYGLDPAAASVCRFWSGQTFTPKSSHFYTPYTSECAYLKQQGVWQYEGDVFGLGLPAGPPGQGTCGTATQPLYRAYNNGMSGAPNHRYTTDPAVLDAMVAQGWSMEGEAATRVFACVPLSE